MEAYANALLIAIPCFMVLLLVEMAYGYATGKQTYVFMDTISSLSSGLGKYLVAWHPKSSAFVPFSDKYRAT
jgi:hypothetical protein